MKSKRSLTHSNLKGKAIVGQSGGCTAVINKSLAGVIAGCQRNRQITHLWGSLYGVMGILKGDFIDLMRQPKELVSQVCALPSSTLGSARYRLDEGREYEIVDRLRDWNVRYLFLVGGNDTAETLLRISDAAEAKKYELRTIHIPKTIDNDLVETDHCPGYGSVARFAAISTQEAGLDTRSMRYVDPVKVIELMGRNAGWIVAAASLLKKKEEDPPHLLLVPEVPFEEESFLKRVDHVLAKVGYCVVVISETIRNKSGERIGARKEGILQDSFGHRYVEGTANCLVRLIEKHIKVRARYDKPGTIQRMSIPYISEVDQKEAFEVGFQAVQQAVKGYSKRMITMIRLPGKKYRIRYDHVSLEKIPHQEKFLPANYLNRDQINIEDSFKKYALPLIGQRQLPDFPQLKAIKPK